MSITATYTIFRITTLPDGLARLEMETNDDDDDGYVDREVVFWEKTMPMHTAESVAGKSRTGFYGQPVDVYLDGKKI